MTRVALPDWPWQIVCRLAKAHGRELWLVGGGVRDALLGRPLHDWDFAVDWGALELARAAANALGGAYYPLDAARGTGRALVTAPDGARLELDFALLRGPDLEADLYGRDFTINALALDPQGRLVDPTGGLRDLGERLIRATADTVFREDPVRLLRALRQQAELGFQLEPHTADLIRRDAALIARPSPERARDELVRVFEIEGAAGTLAEAEAFGLLPVVVPEVAQLKGVTQSAPHRFDVWMHTLHVVDVLEGVLEMARAQTVRPRVMVAVGQTAWADLARALGPFEAHLAPYLTGEVGSGHTREVLLKLAALLHDTGKPGTWSQDEEGRIHFYGHEGAGARVAVERLRELRFGRSEQAFVAAVVEGHMRPPHLALAECVTRRAVYRYFRDMGDAGVGVVLLSLADHLAAWGPELIEARWSWRLKVAETLLAHYFERRAVAVAPLPLIDGSDLMEALDLRAGPMVGRLLDAVREAQAAGEVATREEALALAARLAGHPEGAQRPQTALSGAEGGLVPASQERDSARGCSACPSGAQDGSLRGECNNRPGELPAT